MLRVFALLNTLVLRGLGSSVSVLFTVLVSRYLSTEVAAEFFLLFSFCVIASVCFRWGLDEVIIRRVAPLSGTEVSPVVYKLIALSHRRVFTWLLITLFILVPSFFLGMKEYADQIELSNLLISILASYFSALVACSARVQQGLGYTNYATFLLNIAVPGGCLFGLLGMLTLDITIDAKTLILLYAFIAAAVYYIVVIRYYGTPAAIFSTAKVISWNNSDSSAANKLGGVVLAQQALNWTMLLIIPIAYGAAAYKGFVVVQKVSALASLVMLAVNFTFSSRFALLHASRKFRELRHIIALSLIFILVASVGVFLFLFFGREWVFSYARLDPGMDVLFVVLLVGQIFFSTSSLFAIVLSMSKDDKFLLAAQFVVSAVGIALFFSLSRVASIEYAGGVSILAYSALSLILGLRVLHITRSPKMLG